MDSSGAPQLERRIGLVGATALVVGAVVGAGIYVLVADIGRLTGNALWLAFGGATLISIVGVIPLIQLAGALPRDGAGFFFVSRMLSPYWGALTSFLVLLGGASSTCVVGLTMAKLVPPEWLALLPTPIPGLDALRIAALLLVLLFYAIYQLGVNLAMSLQVVMAAQLLVALGVYAAAGAAEGQMLFSIETPAGPGKLVEATLICYMTCMGFQVVAELGEEVRHAHRNIPLSLIIGGGIVATLYIVVGTIFVTTMPYESYTGAAGELATRPTLTTSAERLLPAWFIPFFALGAWSAGLTSLNAAAIAIPREVFAQARDGILPAALARISPRTKAPQHAVTAYFALVAALLCAGADIDFYGLAAGIGILAMSGILCVASLPLARRFPERYRSAYIVFPRWLLAACAAFTVLASLLFSALLALERPNVLYTYLVYAAAVTVYYVLRTRAFGPADWARLRAVPGEEERR